MGDFLQPNPGSAQPGLSAGPNDLILMGAVFGLGWVWLLVSSCAVDLFSWFMQIVCLAKLNEELKHGRARL